MRRGPQTAHIHVYLASGQVRQLSVETERLEQDGATAAAASANVRGLEERNRSLVAELGASREAGDASARATEHAAMADLREANAALAAENGRLQVVI